VPRVDQGTSLRRHQQTSINRLVPLTVLFDALCFVFNSVALMLCSGRFYPEHRLTAAEQNTRRGRLCQGDQRDILWLAGFVLAASVYLIAIAATPQLATATYSRWGLEEVAVVGITSGFAVLSNAELRRFVLWWFLGSQLEVSMVEARFYFVVDDVAAFPDGPHLSTTFYSSVLPIVAQLVTALGLVIYMSLMTGWSFRTVLFIPKLAHLVVHLMDAVFFARVNRLLGVPDTAFVVGSEVFQDALEAWTWVRRGLRIDFSSHAS